jgi:hypothetical protein
LRPYRRWALILALVGVGWLGACAGDGPPDDAAALVQRSYVDGAEVVWNPAVPQRSADDVHLSVEWTAPFDEAEDLWQRPTVVRASRDRVFVLDAMAERVYVLDTSTGQASGVIGRPGEGPGELQRPFGVALQEAAVVVGNGGRGTLDWFSLEGEYERSLRINAVGFALHGVEPDRFLVNTLVGDRGGWSIIHSDGNVRPVEWPGWLHAAQPPRECARHSTSGTLLLRMSCYRPSVQLTDEWGNAVMEVVIDQEPVEIGDAQIRRIVEENASVMKEDGLPDGLIEEMVRLMEAQYQLSHRWRGVRRDVTSGLIALWEQEIDDLGGGPANLHVISSSGEFLATISLEQSWTDFDFMDGRIHALVQNDVTGLVTLTAYSLLSEGLRRYDSMWGCGMGFGVDPAMPVPRANRRLGDYPSRLVGMLARCGNRLSANSRSVFRS